MNKTVKVNLGGFVFQLDEDAYDLLKSYLLKLEQKFSNTAEGLEIIEDIESRIAELLSAKLDGGREVVNLTDIEAVIGVMGEPDSYMNDEGAPTDVRPKSKGKLYREPQNAVIGGVASGIATHLGINSAWVRLAFLLSLFAWTIGFWAYMVFWIILPARKGGFYQNNKQDESPFVEVLNRIFNFIGNLFKVILRVITIVLGVSLILAGFPVIVALLGFSILPVVNWFPWAGISPQEVFNFLDFAIVQDGSVLTLILLAIVTLVPILMLTYWGVRLLFLIKVKDAWLHITAGVLWLVASIFLGIIVAMNVTMFVDNESSTERVELSTSPDTLRVMMDAPIDLDYYDRSIRIPDEDIAFYYNEYKNESCGLVTFNIRNSNDGLAYFIVEKEVGGSSKSNARRNLQRVTYNYVYNENHLALDEAFVCSAHGIPWIPAQVEVDLYVPKSTVLIVDKRIKRLRETERYLRRLDNELIFIELN